MVITEPSGPTLTLSVGKDCKWHPLFIFNYRGNTNSMALYKNTFLYSDSPGECLKRGRDFGEYLAAVGCSIVSTPVWQVGLRCTLYTWSWPIRQHGLSRCEAQWRWLDFEDLSKESSVFRNTFFTGTVQSMNRLNEFIIDNDTFWKRECSLGIWWAPTSQETEIEIEIVQSGRSNFIQ